MAPLLAAALGAAALGGAYVVYDKLKHAPLDPNKLPLVDPTKNPGLVNALDNGRTYAVLAMYDWAKIPGATPTTPDQAAAATYIKTVFGGDGGSNPGLGFKVLSTPAVRDANEAKKFFAGQPSLWVFNAQWTKDAKYPDVSADLNKIFPTVAFYILPTA
jgi:hypothetical protein